MSLFIICSKFNLGQGPGKDFRVKSYGRDSRHKPMAYISIGNLLRELAGGGEGQLLLGYVNLNLNLNSKNKLCLNVKKNK